MKDLLGRCVIVVSKSRPDVFRALQENFRDPVIWDRRAGSRRAAQRRVGRLSATMAGRRQGERRSPPPPTWSDYGFILTLSTNPAGDGESDREGQEAR